MLSTRTTTLVLMLMEFQFDFLRHCEGGCHSAAMAQVIASKPNPDISEESNSNDIVISGTQIFSTSTLSPNEIQISSNAGETTSHGAITVIEENENFNSNKVSPVTVDIIHEAEKSSVTLSSRTTNQKMREGGKTASVASTNTIQPENIIPTAGSGVLAMEGASTSTRKVSVKDVIPSSGEQLKVMDSERKNNFTNFTNEEYKSTTPSETIPKFQPGRNKSYNSSEASNPEDSNSEVPSESSIPVALIFIIVLISLVFIEVGIIHAVSWYKKRQNGSTSIKWNGFSYLLITLRAKMGTAEPHSPIDDTVPIIQA